jgi:hypothetical protein
MSASFTRDGLPAKYSLAWIPIPPEGIAYEKEKCRNIVI